VRFIYPFTYAEDGNGSGFLKLGMGIRNHYIRWLATEEFEHVERAIPVISLFVGWGWKKLFGFRPFDLDVMDPVAYKIIFKFAEQSLPIDYSLAHWLKVLVRRNLVRQAYKTFMPEHGDKSIRSFNYRPFAVPADIEHRIFISEMQEIVLDYVEHDTRLDFNERKACRYIAEALMKEKLPSPLVLLNKYGIEYRRQEFYLDFTRVVVRSELYKVRDALPFLYGNEEEHFVAVLDDYEYEETENEEDSTVCDF